jgi:alkylhydroperoxidase/carboxymuconolactone decarboxylase family protein YurZ
LRNACSVEEIQEVLMPSTGYSGFPEGIEAFSDAKEVIEAWEKNPE